MYSLRNLVEANINGPSYQCLLKDYTATTEDVKRHALPFCTCSEYIHTVHISNIPVTHFWGSEILEFWQGAGTLLVQIPGADAGLVKPARKHLVLISNYWISVCNFGRQSCNVPVYNKEEHPEGENHFVHSPLPFSCAVPFFFFRVSFSSTSDPTSLYHTGFNRRNGEEKRQP